MLPERLKWLEPWRLKGIDKSRPVFSRYFKLGVRFSLRYIRVRIGVGFRATTKMVIALDCMYTCNLYG